MDETLIPFLRPRGVAVVGASTSPEKLGHGIARNLVASGYEGAIHFVSQRSGDLFGRTLFTDMAQVPDPVDLAVLAVPNAAMPEALRACGRRGIHAAIIVSAGFREAGPEGAALEQECAAVARENGIRLLGPNCIGTIDTHLPLDTSFLQPPMPGKGGVGFISHSGAFCAAIIDWSRREGFGFSQIVSLGNQVDVTESDALTMLAEDEHTKVIVLYMEGVSDGRRFLDMASQVVPRKPVVALKVGRFESGRKAAASHTGALAASDTAFDAAFEKAGILRAASAEEMFDWARALEVCPLPRGKGVAVLTDAGGPGVIAADALEANGLDLAALSETTRTQLATGLPSAASVGNPVDMLASASPEDYARCLRILLDDPAVDSVLVILPPPPMFTAAAVAEALTPTISASNKPVVVALLGSVLVEEAKAVLDYAKICSYPFPERAASALAVLARRAEWLRQPRAAHERPQGIPATALVAAASSSRAVQLVASYGIQTAPIRLAKSSEEAASLARELGFPVVLKIASPDVLHKSDAGGVLLDLQTPEQVVSGYAQVVASVRSSLPQARIQGVLVQRQVSPGQELIIGAVHDPSFGPMVMFGSGGVEAEGLKDIAFALAPLNEAEAQQLMARTWAGRRLDGFRNIAPADKPAVCDALIRLSWLAHDHPEIKEIEINPLRALAQGAVAVDVRLIL